MWGLAVAVVISLYVLVLRGLSGPGPFERQGVTLLGVIAAYLGGGAVAGIVVGLLRPMTRWRWGAVSVGVLAAFGSAVAIGIAMEGHPALWGPDIWFGCTFAALFFGVVGGYKLFAEHPPDERDRSQKNREDVIGDSGVDRDRNRHALSRFLRGLGK
jgi:hypothetical protein